MPEIDTKKLNEIKKPVGFDEPGEHRKKRVNIIKDKRQFSIRIPKRFAEAISIDSDKDCFEFHLISDEETHAICGLEAILIKNAK